jgi:hypothetical protein
LGKVPDIMIAKLGSLWSSRNCKDERGFPLSSQSLVTAVSFSKLIGSCLIPERFLKTQMLHIID